jgi:predicted TIM-barrel fold metal-dependent hydrolase
MIIDVHAHTFPVSMAKRALEVLEDKAGHALEPVGDGTLDCLVRQVVGAGVGRAVFVPIATKPKQFAGILAESLAIRDGERGEAAARHVIPFASVHPSDPEWRAHLKEVAEKGLKGVKVHPYYQEQVLDSPQMLEYFHCCRDLGLVVQCHCGFDIGFPGRAPICGPERVARVIREVPGLKFIAAHLGGWGQWGGVVENLLGKDVMLDTSMMVHLFTDANAQKVLHEHPKDKLLFATDWPWLRFEDGIRFVRDAHFSAADEAAVLGGNAARLLGVAE